MSKRCKEFILNFFVADLDLFKKEHDSRLQESSLRQRQAKKNDKDWTVQKAFHQRGTHRRWESLITKLRGGVR
ncbi:hypothetical protein J6590_061375 [Homalodisca vitripennis]|nr:hypothetical protein J6590_061375 [Homalodisca vitripennis]